MPVKPGHSLVVSVLAVSYKNIQEYFRGAMPICGYVNEHFSFIAIKSYFIAAVTIASENRKSEAGGDVDELFSSWTFSIG